jgi:Protein of unknown function (DUF3727)
MNPILFFRILSPLSKVNRRGQQQALLVQEKQYIVESMALTLVAGRRVVLLVAFAVVVALTPRTTTVVVQAFQQIHVVRPLAASSSSSQAKTTTTALNFASSGASSSKKKSGSSSTTSTTSIALKKSNGGGSSSSKGAGGPELKRVSPDVEGIPIPFIDHTGTSFIECYADSVAHVNGVEYTIGVPCDYSVALCYFDAENNLIPVELDDALMDDIFPIAANIVAEEFDEELVLQRTPQTLTLVGELEDDDDEEQEEEEEEDGEDEDDENDEEEVEVLLTFEHRDKEYHLVRLLDPILLVGKVAPKDSKSSSSSSSLMESSPATEYHATAGKHVFGVSQ